MMDDNGLFGYSHCRGGDGVCTNVMTLMSSLLISRWPMGRGDARRGYVVVTEMILY